MEAEAPAPRQRKAPPHAWKPGHSGNLSGKPRGLPDKLQELQAFVNVNEVSPLEFLGIVMRKDPEGLKKLGINPREVTLPTRIRAAEDALPYVHRRQPVAVDGGVGENGKPRPLLTSEVVEKMSDHDLQMLTLILGKAGAIDASLAEPLAAEQGA